MVPIPDPKNLLFCSRRTLRFTHVLEFSRYQKEKLDVKVEAFSLFSTPNESFEKPRWGIQGAVSRTQGSRTRGNPGLTYISPSG